MEQHQSGEPMEFNIEKRVLEVWDVTITADGEQITKQTFNHEPTSDDIEFEIIRAEEFMNTRFYNERKTKGKD